MSEDEFRYGYSGTYDAKLDPYLQAIGKVAFAWSAFEFNVNDAIWELANLERKAGTCLTSQLIGPGPRFKCLVALLNLRGTPAEIVKKMNSISVEAASLGGQRNRYLHDPIVWDKTDGSIHRMETTADRLLKHEILPVEIQELSDLHHKIEVLGGRFSYFYAHVQEKTPPWPRTQFEQSKGIRRERVQLEPNEPLGEPDFRPPSSAE